MSAVQLLYLRAILVGLSVIVRFEQFGEAPSTTTSSLLYSSVSLFYFILFFKCNII